VHGEERYGPAFRKEDVFGEELPVHRPLVLEVPEPAKRLAHVRHEVCEKERRAHEALHGRTDADVEYSSE
jgi:hypothetical protein